MASVEELLRSSTLYRNLSGEDQKRLAAVSVAKSYESGETIFSEGDSPDFLVTIASGRVKGVGIEPVQCILVRRSGFFALFERHPTFVRGFLTGMAQRIVELTRRIPEVAGGRVEIRFARLFLKLADRMGEARGAARFIPMALSRQELADLTGTTIETCIRIMSRWGKEGVVTTEREGFVVSDRSALERLVEA
jgi:CRP-like cAMP-binding protein